MLYFANLLVISILNMPRKQLSLMGKTITLLVTISSLILIMILTSIVSFKYFNQDLIFMNTISAIRQNARINAYILSYEIYEQSNSNTIEDIFKENDDFELDKNYINKKFAASSSLKNAYNDLYNMNLKMLNFNKNHNTDSYISNLPTFVKTIDNFQIQFLSYLDDKMLAIHLFFIANIVVIVVIFVLFVIFLRDKIINPLDKITQSTSLIENNLEQFEKFDSRTEKNILKLSQSLNNLINSSKLTLDNNSLDQSIKVSNLNKQLSILYQISQNISPATISPKLLTGVLDNIFKNLNLSYLNLVLDGYKIKFGYRNDARKIKDIELNFDDNSFGTMSYQKLDINNDFDEILLKQVAQIITRSWAIFKLQKQQEYLIILEERSVIARELHDSLAQVLSFLKIQVNLLKSKINKVNHNNEEITNLLNDIDIALKKAYIQLRELLSTFRLSVENASLKTTLDGVVKSLQERTNIKIRTSCKIPDDSFSPADLIHILQIVREAMLNAIKHSNAQHIDIIAKADKNCYEIIIKDDGVGLDSHTSPLDHYGLSIMEERAKTLNAKISFTNANGLEIKLIIPVSSKAFKNSI